MRKPRTIQITDLHHQLIRHRITQSRAAEHLGITEAQLCHYLREIHKPSADKAERIRQMVRFLEIKRPEESNPFYGLRFYA